MEDTILKVENIRKSFGSNNVLKDITFNVQKSTCFGILGANGAGKTTLFSILSGILEKDGGKIFINGIDTDKNINLSRKNIGILMNELGIYEKLTSKEFMLFLTAMYGIPESERMPKIKNIFDRLQLDINNDTLIEKYSTGMKKKIAFVASIIHDPEILLLDEPFESVDAIVTYSMEELIKDYVKGGGTVLISSHILQIAEEICHEFVIIDDGKVLKQNTLKNLNGEKLLKYFVESVSKEDNHEKLI